MPNGFTQKRSGSSGSRAVMWPATPSPNPKRPNSRNAAARRCLRCMRSSATSSNVGRSYGIGLPTRQDSGLAVDLGQLAGVDTAHLRRRWRATLPGRPRSVRAALVPPALDGCATRCLGGATTSGCLVRGSPVRVRRCPATVCWVSTLASRITEPDTAAQPAPSRTAVPSPSVTTSRHRQGGGAAAGGGPRSAA